MSSVLENVSIASPCSVDWDSMQGDDKIRFCWLCEQNVYNIAEMTRAEADGLFRQQTKSPCVRMFRRTDGTVITKDCPIGVRMKQGMHKVRKDVCAVIAVLLSVVSVGAFRSSDASQSIAGVTNEAPALPEADIDALIIAKQNAVRQMQIARQSAASQDGGAPVLMLTGPAQTVRVNNAYNLEALIIIFLNILQVVGVARGAYLLFKEYRRKVMARDCWRRGLVWAVILFATLPLAARYLIQWAFSVMRESGFFS